MKVTIDYERKITTSKWQASSLMSLLCGLSGMHKTMGYCKDDCNKQ